jgi:hypothetical protein
MLQISCKINHPRFSRNCSSAERLAAQQLLDGAQRLKLEGIIHD